MKQDSALNVFETEYFPMPAKQYSISVLLKQKLVISFGVNLMLGNKIFRMFLQCHHISIHVCLFTQI